MPPPAASEDDLARVLDDTIELLTSFTIPLYVDGRGGRPEQFGSGFFLEVDSKFVLVSAAHVLREVKKHVVDYYVSPTQKCNLDGTLVIRRGGGNDDDLIDVAGIVLNETASLPQPETGKVPLPISYLAAGYIPRAGKEYLIIGYPSSRNEANPVKRSVTDRAYAYHAPSAASEAFEQLGLSQSSHILIPLDLRRGYDASGNHFNFPKPQGISGSPIWVLYEDRAEESHRAFRLVVVGVATRYKKALKLLMGTDSQAILELIDAAI
ncbi:MAG: hypothetical protein ACU843_11945 [Gammaproteobacteria bacterium]